LTIGGAGFFATAFAGADLFFDCPLAFEAFGDIPFLLVDFATITLSNPTTPLSKTKEHQFYDKTGAAVKMVLELDCGSFFLHRIRRCLEYWMSAGLRISTANRGTPHRSLVL
jgi:hypothetical protein